MESRKDLVRLLAGGWFDLYLLSRSSDVARTLHWNDSEPPQLIELKFANNVFNVSHVLELKRDHIEHITAVNGGSGGSVPLFV